MIGLYQDPQLSSEKFGWYLIDGKRGRKLPEVFTFKRTEFPFRVQRLDAGSVFNSHLQKV